MISVRVTTLSDSVLIDVSIGSAESEIVSNSPESSPAPASASASGPGSSSQDTTTDGRPSSDSDMHAIEPASKREFLAVSVIGAVMIFGFVFVPPKSSQVSIVDFVVFVLGLVALAGSAFFMIFRQFSGRAKLDTRLRILSVLVLIIAMVMFFSVSVYRLSGIQGEISELQTHLDAVYFTVSTSMTVGFGDVVATGQIGRAVVLIQMIFNIVVLAAASKLVATLFAMRRKDQTTGS
jgi:voltage-gated potassium channel